MLRTPSFAIAASTSGSDSSSFSAGMMTSTITRSVPTRRGQNLPHHDGHFGRDQHRHRELEDERLSLTRQIDEHHQVVLEHAQLGVERAVAIVELEHLA